MVVGHPFDCGCPVCQSYARIGLLLASGIGNEKFWGRAADKLRVVEGDLRDEIGELTRQAFGPPPLPTPDPKGEDLPAAAEKGVRTPIAPKERDPSPKASKVKEESREEEEKEPLEEVEEKESAPADSKDKREKKKKTKKDREGATKEKDQRERKEDPKPSKKEEAKKADTEKKAEESREKASSSKRKASPEVISEEEESKESIPRRRGGRAAEKRRYERGDSRSPNSRGGREKKRRNEGVPEPAHPPSWLSSPAKAAVPKSRGPGWIGELPVSSHPRWQRAGKNKGLVKIAKQELHDRQWRSGRGYYRY